MTKLKTKILLGMINDIITEYPNINDFIQQKLIGKCDRRNINRWGKFRSKTFL